MNTDDPHRTESAAHAGMPRWVALAVVIILGIRATTLAWDISIGSNRLPMWDEADHGVHGVKVAEAIRNRDGGRLASLIDARDRWPPLFPLLESQAFLAWGYDYDVARATVIPWYAASILLALVLGIALGGTSGLIAGLCAAALMASSPLFMVFAGLAMLEMPGALLLLVALTFYVRYCRLGRQRDANLTAIATALLFFHKYNYAMLWLAGLLVNEIGRSIPDPMGLVRGGLAIARSAVWRKPFWVFVAIYAAGVTALVVTDGWRGTVAGTPVESPGAGAAIVLLEVMVIARSFLRPRHNVNVIRSWLRPLTPLARSLILFFGMPAALWMANPKHLKHFLAYGTGMMDYPGSIAEHLTYYPREFMNEFMGHAWLGGGLIVLALFSLLLIHRLPARQRILPVALAVGVVMTFLHPSKETRYIFTIVPFVWLSAGLMIGLIFERVSRAMNRRAVSGALAGLVVLVGYLSFFPLSGWAKARVQYEEWTVASGTGEVLDAVADVNTSSRGTVLVGRWLSFSPPLTEWHQMLYAPGATGPSRPRNEFWYRSEAGFIEAIRADGEVDRVVLLLLEPGSPAHDWRFDRDNPTIRETQARLKAHPGITELDYRKFSATGYEMWTYGVDR